MTPSHTIQKPPRLTVQAFWLTFAKTVSALVNIVVPIFLARHMSRGEYGVYKQVFIFAGVAMSIATMGVGTSAFYFLPRRPERGGQVVLNITIYNLVMGLIPLLVLVVYPDILTDVFKVPELQAYALPMGLFTLFMCLGGFLHQIPSALQDVRNSTLLIVGSQFVRAAVFTVAAILMPTVGSILLAAIVYQIWQITLLFWYLRQKFGRFWASFDRAFFQEQVTHAIPLGAFGILGVLRRDIHNFFVSAAFSSAEFAIYAVGSMQTPFIPVIVESVSTVMVVRVSELQHQGRHREVIELIARSMNRLAGILFPVVALLFVTRRELIVLLYKSAYEASANIYAVNLLLLAVTVITLDPVIQAYRELRRFVLSVQIVIFVSMIAALYFAIDQLGMVGAILVAVAANFTERLVVGWACVRVVGAKPRDLSLLGGLGKIAVVAAAAAVAAAWIRDLFPLDALLPRLAAASTCFGVFYAAGAWIFRLPGRELLSLDTLARGLQTVRTKLGNLSNKKSA